MGKIISNKLIIILVMTLLISVSLYFNNKQKKIMNLDYINTESDTPDSYDPLDADKSNNIFLMRMLYHTPIQISADSDLISNVLSHFSYDNVNHEILLKVGNQALYADGSTITSDDVVLAIARMAYFRPNFPFIKDIEGIKEWSESKNGLSNLPKGIILNKNEIKIKLTKNNQNALFRLCLELFSIIPSNCIDKKTGSLTCKEPTPSGYFSLKKNHNDFIYTKRNLINPAEKINYNQIKVSYKPLNSICSEKTEPTTIISATEIGFSNSECKKNIKQNQLNWLPVSRFGAILFNPNVKPFDNKNVRKYYAKRIREIFKQQQPDFIVSGSIFSKLVPGYIQADADSSLLEYPASDRDKITIKIFKSENPSGKIVAESIKKISLELGFKTIDVEKDFIYDSKPFLENEVAYTMVSSGFWPQDPIGDISMYFTHGLHESLKFAWQDKKMYELIENVENETDYLKITKNLEVLNLHLLENSLVAPIVHFRRLLITADGIGQLDIPQSVTSPAPWHINLKL